MPVDPGVAISQPTIPPPRPLIFGPPRPSVISANRPPLHTFLAHAAGPSPAAVKAEQVQAEDDRQSRLAWTAKHAAGEAQHLVDHYADSPFQADKRLRELGFNDSMIDAVRREHPTVDAGGIHVETAHGQVTLPNRPIADTMGVALAGDNPVGHFLNHVTHEGALAGSQLGKAAIGAGPGAIHAVATAVKALGESDRAGFANTPEEKQQLNDAAGSMPATRELGHIVKGTVQSVGQDITHPAQRPGYLAFDVLSALSGGASGVTRFGAGLRAARAAGEGAGAATRLSEGARGFLERPTPKGAQITVHGQFGPESVSKSLTGNPLLQPLQKAFYKRVEGKLNEPAKPSFRERLQAPKEEGGYGYGSKAAGALSIPNRVVGHMVGPEAVFRRGLGASRRTETAVMGAPAEELRGAASTKLPSGLNARLPARLRRGLTPEEDKAIQAVSILGKHAITNPDHAVNLLSNYHERAAAASLADATAAASQISALKTSALQLVNEGRFDELAGVETRIAELEGEARDHAGAHERHTIQSAQFKGVLPTLKAAGEGTASKRFMEVLPQARAVADARANLLKQGGHLTPESEAFRLAGPAAEYRHSAQVEQLHQQLAIVDKQRENWLAGGITPPPRVLEQLSSQEEFLRDRINSLEAGGALHDAVPVAHTSAENPEAKALSGHIAELDKQIAQVHDAYRRSAKRLRPRTAAEAKLELATLHAAHEKQIAEYEKVAMSHKVSPEEAQALLAEHDAKIQAAAAALHEARTGPLTHEDLLIQGQQGRISATSEAMVRAARITTAEKALKSLQRQRKRFADAVDTGRLRIPHDAKETAARNRLGAGAMPTLKEELRADIERNLEDVVRRHPNEPAVKAVAERMARMEQLKAGLELHDEAHDPLLGTGKPLTAEQLTHHFGTVPVGADDASRTRLGALVEYRTALEGKLEKALGQEPKLHTLLDETMLQRKELPPVEGAFRAPLGSSNDPALGSPFAAPFPGKGGMGPPDAARRDSALNHEFGAGEIKHGDLTGATVDAIANSYLKAARIRSQEGEYARYWRLSKPTRESADMVPIREPKNIPLEFKQELKRIADRPEGAKTLADLERDVGETLDRYLRGVDTTAAEKEQLSQLGLPGGLWRQTRTGNRVAVPVGTDLSHLGIRWVKKDYMEAPRTPKPTSKAMAGVDFLNDLGRLGVYARGGYILNLPSNWAMQALEQGHLAPAMYRRAFDLRSTYGHELASKIEATVGEGRARGYNLEGSPIGNATGLLASMWSSLIDRHSRVSAFLYWAHRHGVNLDDPVAMKALFHESNRATLQDISERANKSMVQFNNLNPLERDTIRHLVYFYPWVSRATAWAVKTLIEHPHKSWTISELGQIADANRDKQFGVLPKTLQQRGYVPFTLFGKTYMIGTASVNPLQTVADVGRQLASPLSSAGLGTLSEAASPALQAGLELATGRDQYGQQFKGSTIAGVAKDVFVSGTPQGQAIQRGLFGKRIARLLGKKTDYSRTPEEKKPTFPGMGFGEGMGPLQLGSLYPRQPDLQAVGAHAHADQLAALPAPQRAVARERDTQAKFVADLQAAGLIKGPPPPELTKLFQERQQRTAAYAQAAEKDGVAVNRLTIRDRFAVDIDLAVQRGLITPADKATLLAHVAKMSDAQVKYVRHTFHGAWFTEDHAIAELRSAVREIQGAKSGG